MHILIIGAAGMIGRKLSEQLLDSGQLNNQPISEITLVDVIEPVASQTSSSKLHTVKADLTAAGAAEKLIKTKPDVIYHLAAIVSGEAEADFDKGYLINMDGTRALLDAIRAQHAIDNYTPKLIFTSSIAVYGAPFPPIIDDEFHQTPLTSYGTQKAICELMIADCNRRGFLQAIGLRLPTICIRPGLPNKAASGFFSNILREPINGKSAVLPVDDTVRHWFASPRAAIGFLLHAASLTSEDTGLRCNMNLPGLCATVAEQIDALNRVVGSEAVGLIERRSDPTIKSIVANWPEAFDATRAISMGFVAEQSFDEIINVYLEDELPDNQDR